MHIIRAAQHRTMPWKNGGGSTTEIAVFPEGADLANFGWRISMARVETDGPFSRFENIDRTLSVLSGAGIALRLAGRTPVTLTPESPPLAFPGDVETHATLLGGSITDLNVMTRRGAFSHAVTRFDGALPQRLSPTAPTALLLSRGDGLVLSYAEGSATLDTDDVAYLAGPAEVTPNGAEFFLIEIFAAG